MKTTKIHWLLVLAALGSSCKERYNAPVHAAPTGYLVVEGFINVGGDTTRFSLSRTTGLDSPYIIPENGALIEVQSAGGNSYPLTELGGGKYALGTWNVDMTQQYRIHIKTVNGREYQSDLSSPKLTPPIDSVSWKPINDGVDIYVSTHDPTNNSRYYQWDYEETWEYASAYASFLIYVNHQLLPRPDSAMFHICYFRDTSSDINVGSTAKLTDDVLFENELEFIPYGATNKLERKYSILVKQHVLNKEWYEWKEKLKKNTEQLGSIFDAQPSDISGNIHSLADSVEPVIGFVGCSSETSQRIFITRSQLPQTYVYTGYEDCMVDTIKGGDLDDLFDGGGLIPIGYAVSPMGAIIGYTASTAYCVDCRVFGGVTAKPDFWP